MSTLLNVPRRPAESADQEIAQPLLCSREIFGRVHRTEDVVCRNLGVKGSDQPAKSVFADEFVNAGVVHQTMCRSSGSLAVAPARARQRNSRPANTAARTSATRISAPVSASAPMRTSDRPVGSPFGSTIFTMTGEEGCWI